MLQMPTCAAYGCTVKYTKDCNVKFHRFPSNPDRHRQWIVRVNRLDESGKLWKPSKDSRLCSVRIYYLFDFIAHSNWLLPYFKFFYSWKPVE